MARNSIVSRDSTGKFSGTGPFAVAQWDAGKHVTLTANDQYWAGRAFLDSVQIDFGKNDRDQMLALDLGKADVVEVSPENIHRARAENRMVMTSEPEELMTLVFAQDPRSDDEAHARNALALSIDTAAVNNVVLQGGGEPERRAASQLAFGVRIRVSHPVDLPTTRVRSECSPNALPRGRWDTILPTTSRA